MGEPTGAAILGTGSYLPPNVLTNADLEEMVETSDEWITSRTGIRERRIASPEQATSDLCVEAGRRALEAAGIGPEDIGLIIVSTLSPDCPFPGTACIVQDKLGAGSAAAFDLAAGCTGFVYALSVARQFVMTGTYRHVLAIAGETCSRVVDYTDRSTCVLFGDGAGAAVVGPSGGGREILLCRLAARGSGFEKLWIPAGGSRRPASRETVDAREHFMKLNGPEIFKFAVQVMCEELRECSKALGKSPEDIALVVPHQANYRIIRSVCHRVGVPAEKVYQNLEKYGNTSAASVPIALDEATQDGGLSPGDLVVLVAFGGGLTYGSSVIRW